MKLIENANRFYKLASIQIASTGVVFEAAIHELHDFREWVGDKLAHEIGFALFIFVIIGRLLKKSVP